MALISGPLFGFYRQVLILNISHDHSAPYSSLLSFELGTQDITNGGKYAYIVLSDTNCKLQSLCTTAFDFVMHQYTTHAWWSLPFMTTCRPAKRDHIEVGTYCNGVHNEIIKLAFW